MIHGPSNVKYMEFFFRSFINIGVRSEKADKIGFHRLRTDVIGLWWGTETAWKT